MPILPIINLPDPVLRLVSQPVERVDATLQRLIDDMFETMYAAPGLGLAAVQVNQPIRLIVLDVADDDLPKDPLVLINPEIVELGDTRAIHDEGCLSLPDVRYEVERPTTVTVRFMDRAGKIVDRAASGLLATAIQHEVDHLDGRLIIDYMSKLRREMVIRKLKKIARDGDA
jgi:peptide deformylase